MNLSWTLKRLQRMSIAEIAYRVSQTAHAKLEQLGIGLAKPQTPKLIFGKPWLTNLPYQFNKTAYINAADRILSGTFDVFSMPNTQLGFPPQWNQDCRTGKVVPLKFGKTLDYRNEELVGDIKYLWEPNRHLQLVTLAQAWHLSNDLKYLQGCRTLLESWFQQCPYPLGVNWTSSLEHAYRLVNWSITWHLIGGENSRLFEGTEGQAFLQHWLSVIYYHCYFIGNHFSRYSSANNHLLGEYMGLFVGSVTWPCWIESNTWLTLTASEFEKQALLQNAPDGVNREQAIWYQHGVSDMMLLCGLMGEANNVKFSKDYWKRLENMLEFNAAIMDVGGNIPMTGDSDDSMLVKFNCNPTINASRALLAIGAILFSRADFKAAARECDDKTRWLLGDVCTKDFNNISVTDDLTPKKQAFTEGGYYIMGGNWGTSSEIRLVADVAPLGYLSISAHGHADALAFTLSLGGLELLIDPGTFAYHTQKQWRDYFRGTSAHNTLRIDGVDQSLSGGNFMWLKHANATLECFETHTITDRLIAHHDGYLSLRNPVLHRREIALNKQNHSIQVLDTLETTGKHHVEIYWHCHEDAKITLEGSVIKISRARTLLRLTMPDTSLSVRLARSEETPPLGWISRQFDDKLPTTTIVWSGEINGLSTLATHMDISWI